MLNQIDEISGIGLHLDLVLRRVQDAYLKKFEELGVDLTIEQWVILHRISELGATASQREIVRSNFRNRATTSRVIGKLEKKGWISKTRFEGDQKRYKLELTRKGKKVIKLVLPHAVNLRKLAIRDLESEDFEVFLKVLDQIGYNYYANKV
ncbi:MarR family winged helix-turn-helix transcriptional regulator [Flagellimonas myxillae]|uniref:MarR family winged helix-turn-helix transcriptional regulator n=1 Tax=Flagellimonas myxillae TaxID=2942214 RepID=UPI00201F7C4B|nr:MarR family transcriptional regulator [Muricauda myxillae]MCL6267271.1 MarR family transcriptional regulator [Muricauda myxillae]